MMNEIENLQTKEQFFMNPLIQQNIAMITGEQQKNKKQELSPEEKEQITKKYVNMYYALAAIHWCKGGTLGRAWQKALNQMDNFVKSKTKVLGHPMNPHLISVHAQFKRRMSESLLTNPYVDCETNLSKEHKEQWIKFSTEYVKSDMAFFNSMHDKYMPKEKIQEKSAKEPFKQAQQKVLKMVQKNQAMLQLYLKQRVHQRAA